MNISLLHLKYFLKTAEKENISRAAEELLISQPSLSATLSRLEQNLNVRLFAKNGRNIQLTKEGAIVYRYAANIFSQLDHMAEELRTLSGTSKAARLALPQGIIMPSRINQFTENHPEYHLEYTYLSLENSLQALRTGKVDMVYHLKQPVLSNIDTIPLYQCYYHLIVSPLHPFADRKTISLKELQHTSMFLPNQELLLRQIIDAFFEKEHFKPIILGNMQHSLELFRAVRFNAGVTVLPVSSYTIEDTYEGLVFIPIAESLSKPLQACLYCLQDQPLSPAACALKDHILSVFIK